jgi:hypothetical protein
MRDNPGLAEAEGKECVKKNRKTVKRLGAGMTFFMVLSKKVRRF